MFNPNIILELLAFHINHNIFELADLTLQQIKGTAMGSPFSPTIANIFMSILLEKFWMKTAHRPR
jgi:hypothetical protein